MKNFRKSISVWHLSVLLLLFNISESAVVNQTQALNGSTSPVARQQTTDILDNSTANNRSKKISYSPCKDGINMKCIKMEIVQYIEQLSEKQEIQLLPGLEIARDNDVEETSPADLATEITQKYPNDSGSRLNAYIFTKFVNYMQSHHLRFKLVDEKAISDARSLSESARSKGKKGGGLEALMAAGIAMKGTLMAIGMGALALLAGKALTASLMALMLAAVAALKGDGGKEVKYEIISKPIHTSSHKHHDEHLSHSAAYPGYAR